MKLEKEDIEYFTKLLMMYGMGEAQCNWKTSFEVARSTKYYQAGCTTSPTWDRNVGVAKFYLTDKAIAAIKEMNDDNSTT